MVERAEVTHGDKVDRQRINRDITRAIDELRGLGGPGNREDALAITALEEALFRLHGGVAGIAFAE